MSEESKISKAQQKAVHKYVKNNYDRLEITVPKGKKDAIKAYIATKGESLNGFVNRAIDETLERDNPISPPATPEKSQPTAEPPTKPVGGKLSSITAFTPDARKAVDLNQLLSDIRYQLDIQAMYGIEVLTDLLDEAKSIQESDPPVTDE